MDTFGDPGFYCHQTLVKIWGLLALRLAESTILPISPGDYADTLTEYAKELPAYSTTAQSKGFPILKNAALRLVNVADTYEKSLQSLKQDIQIFTERNERLPKELAKAVTLANKRLTYFERGFLDPQGIKDRTWFKHVVYAPSLWSGYSSQVFPALIEAMDAGDYDMARHTEKRIAQCIDNASQRLSQQ